MSHVSCLNYRPYTTPVLTCWVAVKAILPLCLFLMKIHYALELWIKDQGQNCIMLYYVLRNKPCFMALALLLADPFLGEILPFRVPLCFFSKVKYLLGCLIHTYCEISVDEIFTVCNSHCRISGQCVNLSQCHTFSCLALFLGTWFPELPEGWEDHCALGMLYIFSKLPGLKVCYSATGWGFFLPGLLLSFAMDWVWTGSLSGSAGICLQDEVAGSPHNQCPFTLLWQ